MSVFFFLSFSFGPFFCIDHRSKTQFIPFSTLLELSMKIFILNRRMKNKFISKLLSLRQFKKRYIFPIQPMSHARMYRLSIPLFQLIIDLISSIWRTYNHLLIVSSFFYLNFYIFYVINKRRIYLFQEGFLNFLGYFNHFYSSFIQIQLIAKFICQLYIANKNISISSIELTSQMNQQILNTPVTDHQNYSKQKLAESIQIFTRHQSISQYSSPLFVRKQSDALSTLIKSKASIYMTSKPLQGRLTPVLDNILKQNKKTLKLFHSTIDFPRIRKLQDLIRKEKQLYHIYRQKMQFNFDQCLLFYMDIILSAIKYEFQISHQAIDRDESLLIDCFIFVASSLVQIGMEKLAFYFCTKGVRLCQIYGKLQQLGHMLFLIGCIARKLQKFEDSLIFFKKGLEYLWKNRTLSSNERQIQTYNQLSQCLLQINRVDQSKIFAYKYQIGYLEKNNSKIIELSSQLINSVQGRKSKWHAITHESVQLLLEFDIEEFMQKNTSSLIRMDQKKVIQLMKINFQFLYDGFLQNDMFFYQVPMPLEIVTELQKTPKKIKERAKFLIKTKSQSVGNLKSYTPAKVLKAQPNKPKQFLIFNYRGGGVSKQKLSAQFQQLVKKIKQMKNLKTQEKVLV